MVPFCVILIHIMAFVADVHFMIHDDTDCNRFVDIKIWPRDDLEACKIWCAENQRCGGFTVKGGRCWFKGTTCDQDIHSRATTLYLKQF